MPAVLHGNGLPTGTGQEVMHSPLAPMYPLHVPLCGAVTSAQAEIAKEATNRARRTRGRLRDIGDLRKGQNNGRVFLGRNICSAF